MWMACRVLKLSELYTVLTPAVPDLHSSIAKWRHEGCSWPEDWFVWFCRSMLILFNSLPGFRKWEISFINLDLELLLKKIVGSAHTGPIFFTSAVIGRRSGCPFWKWNSCHSCVSPALSLSPATYCPTSLLTSLGLLWGSWEHLSSQLLSWVSDQCLHSSSWESAFD